MEILRQTSDTRKPKDTKLPGYDEEDMAVIVDDKGAVWQVAAGDFHPVDCLTFVKAPGDNRFAGRLITSEQYAHEAVRYSLSSYLSGRDNRTN